MPSADPLQLQKLVQHIVQRLQPRKVVLFGSYAYGHPHEDSDVDLLIVLPHPPPMRERWKIANELRPHSTKPLQMVFMSPEEFEETKDVVGGSLTRRPTGVNPCMTRTPEQVIWDFVQGWLRKATGDLQAAERLLDLHQEDNFAAACHAQQAAEKFLKAFLVRYQIPFPKTHDIQDLLKLAARADPTMERELSSATMVTPFGVEFRYPGDEIANHETAQHALDEAKRVQAVVLSRLADYLRDAGRL